MLTALRKRRADAVAAAEVAELERIAAIPFPTARVPLRPVELQKEDYYNEIAESLDFVPTELTRARLLGFFEADGIKLYDYSQVKAWLTGKKEQAKATHWCWRPLRKKDIPNDQWGWNQESRKWEDGFYLNNWTCCPYDRLVPTHALEKIVKIKARFGDRVKFFVSDYASPNPDPFVMVRPAMPIPEGIAADEYLLIFDVWDEPGFGV